MTFSKKAITQEIDGENVVVQFFADANFEGKTFSVVVNAELGVNADGDIVREGWIVTNVAQASLTNEALIKETSTHDQKAEPVEHHNLPPDIQKSIDDFEDTKIEYYDEASDWTDGDRAYFLVKNNDGDVVGYLVSDSWKSESVDIKIYFTLKFDSAGNFIESVSESFGYHE